MRERTDGLTECGFSELTAAQKAEALALLPSRPAFHAACPFCKARVQPQLKAGRQICGACAGTVYPPPWHNDAGKLMWRVSSDGAVVGFDPEIRF